MSEVRDTTAIIEAFDKLTKHYADQLAPKALSELRKPFLKNPEKAARE